MKGETWPHEQLEMRLGKDSRPTGHLGFQYVCSIYWNIYLHEWLKQMVNLGKYSLYGAFANESDLLHPPFIGSHQQQTVEKLT